MAISRVRIWLRPASETWTTILKPSHRPCDHRPFSCSSSPRASSPNVKTGGGDLKAPSVVGLDQSKSQVNKLESSAKTRRRTGRSAKKGYNFLPPMYYRGPLHPIQPLPKTDPASREFVPGPFSLPRLLQTYDSTIESDLMTLFYQHIPPGTKLPQPPPRLRRWEGDSPYFKNRPLRAPRGFSQLPLLRKMITFRNIPRLERITVSSIVPEAPTNSAHLHAAGMVLQALTGNRATVHIARSSSQPTRKRMVQQKARKPIAVTSQMEGEQMWHFLSTLSSIVLPRIKDWKGVKGTSGDRSGNISIGLRPESVGNFPEIAINYDAYPANMIPGIDIILHTTAAVDRDARLLLTALGLPFQRGGR